MPDPTPSTIGQTGLSDNAAGGLAYVTVLPAIVFLILAPYNQSSFIRFHAWQSIFLNIACVVVYTALAIVGHLPFFGFLMLFLIPLVWLGFFIVWLLVLVKAFNGGRLKLPVLGDLAEKQAHS